MADPGKVLVGGAKGTPNPGGNHPNALHRHSNGKGVGDNPAVNQPYMSNASANNGPLKKYEKAGKIVGQ